jgi:hypothetical protein
MARALRIPVSDRIGEVSALLERPRRARALLALAHGAGADMRHRFMEEAAAALAREGVATLRYQFPYSEAGRKRPDHRSRLLATVYAALARGEKEARGLPLLAGGKSMGGRMSSLAIAEDGEGRLAAVRGVVFFGFPLHAAGSPSDERADHLDQVAQPLLFLQGSRDRLADLDRLRPRLRRLGRRARLHVIEGADHSFHVPRRSGRSDDEVIAELAGVVAAWAERLA